MHALMLLLATPMTAEDPGSARADVNADRDAHTRALLVTTCAARIGDSYCSPAFGYDDRQIFAITLFVALRLAFSTVNDELGATPDSQLTARVPAAVRSAVTFGRPPAPSLPRVV